ncbi:hypothetical protein ACFYXM_11485 [Streptomyces sp. NPDC002476]|uniref:hypothetical protein n=1 Tax=Streptomyces sp. NPDC002476 TaxID=3364648 RepID=UPI0036C5CE57
MTPEHRVFPKTGDRSCATWGCEDPDPSHAHGPAPFCDVMNCRYCCHDCDCGVCDGTLHAPQLTVLEDIPDHELAQITRRRNARSTVALTEQVSDLRVHDHIAATGRDARGQQTLRTGYLLAAPKIVTSRRSGVPTKALRLAIGTQGADPQERSTWTTLFVDEGTVERVPEPQPDPWLNTTLCDVPGVTASSHATRIVYGGTGAERPSTPGTSPVVHVLRTQEDIYVLWDPATDTSYAALTPSSRIWWAPPPGAATAATVTAA